MATCAMCNKEIVDTQYKTKNKKRYHQECFNEVLEKAEKKNEKKAVVAKIGDKYRSKRNVERKSLMRYICSLYGTEEVSFIIDKQIETYVNQLGYTYSGIEKALYYFYEMEGNPIGESNTIGIVPYVYEEAKKFFRLIYEADEANKNFDRKEETVCIRMKPKKRDMPYIIDINDIFGEK